MEHNVLINDSHSLPESKKTVFK